MIRRFRRIGCNSGRKVSVRGPAFLSPLAFFATAAHKAASFPQLRANLTPDSLLTGVEASAAQNAPVTKTCLQCGSILPAGVRVCSFCDSRLPSERGSESIPSNLEADPAWRGEVVERVASYRARRRKSPPDDHPQLPFDACEPRSPGVAVAEPAQADDFSFSIAIGRTTNRQPDDGQMFIDVSLPPGDDRPGSPEAALQQEDAARHPGLYPVASIEERRIAGAIDAACLAFACGGFLALFGSLGGHFALSKLSAAVYAASFAIVYLQYFALFTIFGGTTPGMMLRGLRVVDFSGEEPAPRQLLLRAAGYLLSAGTFFLGFLWAQWDEDELTWHDRISRTYLSSAQTLADSELRGAVHGH